MDSTHNFPGLDFDLNELLKYVYPDYIDAQYIYPKYVDPRLAQSKLTSQVS